MTGKPAPEPFWERLPLDAMNPQQWESLCDGCGWCCLLKLEDEDSGQVVNTRAACRLLDVESCRCTDYGQRFSRVPDCVRLTADNLAGLLQKPNWLPPTCAYRLVHDGQPLPDWHPLVSQRADSVHEALRSVRPFAVSETHIHLSQLAELVMDFP